MFRENVLIMTIRSMWWRPGPVSTLRRMCPCVVGLWRWQWLWRLVWRTKLQQV